MQYIKYLNFIIPAIVVGIIIFSQIRSYKNARIEKEIEKNPIYVDAVIKKIVPGTPSSNGLVNITVDYSFTDFKGSDVERSNFLTAIKTMDLYKFEVGGKIPVLYLKTDSTKNMLAIKSAFK